MKKGKKICIILLTIIVIWGAIFLTDYIRVKNNKTPIFCIKNPAGVIMDGGTTEYFGLGYKVIDFNRLGGYDEIKIGTWSMKYEDFSSEYKNEALQAVEEQTESVFYATIIEKHGDYLLVSPDENTEERKSIDKISISAKDNNWEVGTRVKVVYDGIIMTTYPGQVNTSKVEELPLDPIEKMYKTIIDEIMSQDDGLNQDAKYISLDVDSFVSSIKINDDPNNLPLSEEQKETLINYCKKYNLNVKGNSMEQLKEQGLFNEELMGIEGILIYASKVEEISQNHAIISMTKYRGGNGAIFPKYELNYKDGQWEIKTLEMAIS